MIVALHVPVIGQEMARYNCSGTRIPGYYKIRISGNLNIRISGNPDIRISGFCNIPVSWYHMARFGLRIRLFEAHSHFLSIANPPDPKSNGTIPTRHFSKIRKIRKSNIFASITLVCPVKADTDMWCPQIEHKQVSCWLGCICIALAQGFHRSSRCAEP